MQRKDVLSLLLVVGISAVFEILIVLLCVGVAFASHGLLLVGAPGDQRHAAIESIVRQTHSSLGAAMLVFIPIQGGASFLLSNGRRSAVLLTIISGIAMLGMLLIVERVLQVRSTALSLLLS